MHHKIGGNAYLMRPSCGNWSRSEILRGGGEMIDRWICANSKAEEKKSKGKKKKGKNWNDLILIIGYSIHLEKIDSFLR